MSEEYDVLAFAFTKIRTGMEEKTIMKILDCATGILALSVYWKSDPRPMRLERLYRDAFRVLSPKSRLALISNWACAENGTEHRQADHGKKTHQPEHIHGR